MIEKTKNENPRVKKSENENLRMKILKLKKSENGKSETKLSETKYNLVFARSPKIGDFERLSFRARILN